MYCKNCGANISENDRKCSYCNSEINDMAQACSDDAKALEQATTNNSLLGKEYQFSGNDLVVRGRWGISFKISVGEDRLFFETVPAKKNTVPVAILEDILAIDESFHMRTGNIILAVLGLLLGFAGGLWWFLVPILVLFLYRDRKMKIHLRNGKIITVYSDNKEDIGEFIADIKTITKIK